eukprot:TRINITY_DN26809_c0_g1_i2.p1 TRINITY_DN26809_c0_g1~~TRINITY_DN26809_c0_g1_i2.p1  ORF type:complete len:530 (+),score=95.44 TRINITY_DN26809_c0_g1_i2:184-1590(+)
MQGWRPEMEDAHICLPSVGKAVSSKAQPSMCSRWNDIALFGVMDGHGGEQVAKYCERHLPDAICAYPLNGAGDSGLKPAFIEAFHSIDDMLRDKDCLPELQSLTNVPAAGPGTGRMNRMRRDVDPDFVGCTCVMCCLTQTQIVVANCGDSRAVLSRGGAAVALSQDHKPNDPIEEHRIKAAGGFVETQNMGGTCQYRVCGNLNLSRALGDLEYKKDRTRPPGEQIISATPDVEFYDRTPEDEFLLICCDGVWDVKTCQQAIDFVRCRLPEGADSSEKDMVKVLEDLLDDCVSKDVTQLREKKGLGGDNMTAVLVVFPGFHGLLPDATRRPVGAAANPASVVAEAVAARSSGAAPSGPTAKLLRVVAGPRGEAASVKVFFELQGEGAHNVSAGDVDVWLNEKTSELEVSVLPSQENLGSPTLNVSLKQWLEGKSTLAGYNAAASAAQPEVMLCRRRSGQVTLTVILPLR